jgi:G protein beta subunit-like protein
VSNFSAHKSNVTAIGFEKQGEFLYSGSEDGTIKIWDPRVANYQREFAHTEPCNTVELHPNQVRHAFEASEMLGKTVC